jgi:hypothetical protein
VVVGAGELGVIAGAFADLHGTVLTHR